MNDIAIHVNALSKQYRIGKKQEKYRTLRDSLSDSVAAPFRRLQSILRGQSSGANGRCDMFWALEDLSFQVRHGDVVGIIGRNGAGKSTLLKILSRITEPTTGFVDIRGRVGSLLEVGTGFHPELTGRENLYLNGAILGMKRAEIDRKFDEIVAFAEVEKFIDTPVKHYSSGMYLRLAFAVAAHLQPEILLVDEVLAVGDAAFQKKCLGKMDEVAKQGRTVLFVSHNMGAIAQLCGRAIWLERGQLKAGGTSPDVIASYLSSGTMTRSYWNPKLTPSLDLEMQIQSVCVLSASNQPTAVVEFDKPFKVEIVFEVISAVKNLCHMCRVTDSQGTVVWTSWNADTTDWNGRILKPGKYLAICKIPGNLLRPGRYSLSIDSQIFNGKHFGYYQDALFFDVSEVGCHLNSGRLGIITPLLDWELKTLDEDTTDDSIATLSQ